MSAIPVTQSHADRYDNLVVPTWSAEVDNTLVHFLHDLPMGTTPTVLVPESRTGHLVLAAFPALPERTRFMVVDPSSEMLDACRQRLKNAQRSIFYSGQSITKLSYAQGVFDAILAGYGFVTQGDIPLAGGELLRVLRPNGIVAAAITLRHSIPTFTDMLRESLLKLEMRDIESALDAFHQALIEPEDLAPAFAQLGLHLTQSTIREFTLHFPSVEDFLFSPFIESTFLPRWLAICTEPEQRKPILTHVVRTLNTYFYGRTLPVPVRVACVLLQRQ